MAKKGNTGLSGGLKRALENAAKTNTAAAAKANQISESAQSAQGTYNQASVDNANMIMQENLLAQQAFNSAQAKATNEYNAMMWERASQYNAAEAEKARKWQEYMQSTAFQRQVKDLKAAGLNPILAANLGGAGASSGAIASIGSSTGAMASSGLQTAQSANVGTYTGQMENTSNELALFGALVTGLSTAMEAADNMGYNMNDFKRFITKSFWNTKNGGGGRKF